MFILAFRKEWGLSATPQEARLFAEHSAVSQHLSPCEIWSILFRVMDLATFVAQAPYKGGEIDFEQRLKIVQEGEKAGFVVTETCSSRVAFAYVPGGWQRFTSAVQHLSSRTLLCYSDGFGLLMCFPEDRPGRSESATSYQAPELQSVRSSHLKSDDSECDQGYKIVKVHDNDGYVPSTWVVEHHTPIEIGTLLTLDGLVTICVTAEHTPGVSHNAVHIVGDDSAALGRQYYYAARRGK